MSSPVLIALDMASMAPPPAYPPADPETERVRLEKARLFIERKRREAEERRRKWDNQRVNQRAVAVSRPPAPARGEQRVGSNRTR